jgi:hypothetical protein
MSHLYSVISNIAACEQAREKIAQSSNRRDQQ